MISGRAKIILVIFGVLNLLVAVLFLLGIGVAVHHYYDPRAGALSLLGIWHFQATGLLELAAILNLHGVWKLHKLQREGYRHFWYAWGIGGLVILADYGFSNHDSPQDSLWLLTFFYLWAMLLLGLYWLLDLHRL